MEKKSANDIIRSIVREEITRALKQELPKIIKESMHSSNKIVNKKNDSIPLTLNSGPMVKYEDIKFKNSSNPLANLLNETAKDMLNEDSSMHFTTANVSEGMHPTMVFQPKEAAIGGINDMLSTARSSGNVDTVQINTVPDYSAMLDKLGI